MFFIIVDYEKSNDDTSYEKTMCFIIVDDIIQERVGQ